MSTPSDTPEIRWNPTDEQVSALAEWLEGRPQVVRDLADRFPPWGWFRKRDDEGPFWVYAPVAYNEDGTLRMAKYSVGTGEGMITVFGIHPDSLEPCGSPEEMREGLSEEDRHRAEVLTGFEMLCHGHAMGEDDPPSP